VVGTVGRFFNEGMAMPLPFWKAYLLVVAGILMSVMVPWALRWLVELAPPVKSVLMRRGYRFESFATFIKPILKFAAAAAILAPLLLVAAKALNKDVTEPYQAVLLGYLWDSTLQKIREGAGK